MNDALPAFPEDNRPPLKTNRVWVGDLIKRYADQYHDRDDVSIDRAILWRAVQLLGLLLVEFTVCLVLGIGVWHFFGSVLGCLVVAVPAGIALCRCIVWELQRDRARIAQTRDGVCLRRSDAPDLFALIDEVGTYFGDKTIDQVCVGDDVGASASPDFFRWRFRRPTRVRMRINYFDFWTQTPSELRATIATLPNVGCGIVRRCGW